MIPSSGRAVTKGKILRRKKIRFSEVTALPEEGSFSEGRNSASPVVTALPQMAVGPTIPTR